MVSTDSRATRGPARGTRPANRRQLIVRAAEDLFYRKGYAKVGMGEVAEAVAIGPSALYRHFRGKQDLLVTVIDDAMRTLEQVLAEATPTMSPNVWPRCRWNTAGSACCGSARPAICPRSSGPNCARSPNASAHG